MVLEVALLFLVYLDKNKMKKERTSVVFVSMELLFVASSDYAEEWRKKKDLYVFTAGSCFVNCFAGDIYDVSEGGKHPVYRYAKPIFMGVSL